MAMGKALGTQGKARSLMSLNKKRHRLDMPHAMERTA
jgi:hypothetical protein